MKSVLISLLVAAAFVVQGQVSDSVILSNLFSHRTLDIKNNLDSLGVYYHLHLIKDNKESRQIIISIANSSNSLKVYTIKAARNGFPKKIIVSYQHDNYLHMHDLDNLKGYYIKRIGHYSTDITFFSTASLKKNFPTRKFEDYQLALSYADKVPASVIYYYDNGYIKYYYVGIYKTEDEKKVHFLDGLSLFKKNMMKIN